MKKSIVTAITAMALVLSFGLSACGGGEQPEEEHVHEWTVVSTTATCGEGGVTTYSCECGETKTEDTPATGKHEYGSDNVCSVCGYVNFGNLTVAQGIEKYGYYLQDKDESNTYSTGDIVYFGSYPQNMVETTAALDAAAGRLPTADDAGDWTGYGYYSEGVAADYAFYRDVTVDGAKYRGVYLLDYRPYYSGLAAGTAASYIDDEGYSTQTVYWFKYAPIQWNVLEYRDGSLFLNAKYVLESQPFQETYEKSGSDYVIPGATEYVNNWQYSSLRAFLNGAFYDKAFTETQRSMILPTMLDNRTTGYAADAPYQKDQNDTQDKVFLPSYQDVLNTDYGYASKGGANRARSYTAYSVIQGLRTSSDSVTEDGEPACFYALRSAADGSQGICGVSKKGSASSSASAVTDESVDGLAFNSDLGVLPAVYVRVGKAAQGVWKDFTFDGTQADGESVQATCSLYLPAAYVGGTALPLITYIADSSYANATLAQYKAAQCPSAWLTEEKMSRSPSLFLIICGSPSASLVASVIDRVAEQYGADGNRLYLTGQSMGGITDFLLNDTYPDKFAATVYVDCQPGGEVHNEQYDAIIANAKFVNQKFVYIASRKDELASQGQDDVEAVLSAQNVSYGKLYDLDHKDNAALNAAIKAVLDQGYDHNFFGFKQLTSSGNTAAEHMQSFQYGYAVDAIFDWLMNQHL